MKIALFLAFTLASFQLISAGPQPHQPSPELHHVEEDWSLAKHHNSHDRTLQTTTYPQIRITANFDRLAADPVFQAYVQNDLAPPVISFFQNALKVKYPLTAPLKFTTGVICSGTIPQDLMNGVNMDYYYFYEINTDNTTITVADSYNCYLSTVSKRPLVSRTQFYIYMFKPDGGNILLHEKNMLLLMHEMTHTFGFSRYLYSYFLDSNDNTLTGHIKNGTLDGKSCIVLDVPPLTSKLRTFFGCPTLDGAYMENDGSDASIGGHFEGRQFVFEVMTSLVIYEQKYSQSSLVLLEGSGWYVPDYSYADPYFFGQGQGCDFLNGTCQNQGTVYEEFCAGSSRGCSFPGRGGGSCVYDIKSDGCRYQSPDVDYDCENINAANNLRLPSLQVFGRGLGSKCFSGNLTTAQTDTASALLLIVKDQA